MRMMRARSAVLIGIVVAGFGSPAAAQPPAAQFVASVGLRPKVEVVEGNLSAQDFNLVRQWIELNRDVIIGYWDRDIEDTGDAIALLKPLPKG